MKMDVDRLLVLVVIATNAGELLMHCRADGRLLRLATCSGERVPSMTRVRDRIGSLSGEYE